MNDTQPRPTRAVTNPDPKRALAFMQRIADLDTTGRVIISETIDNLNHTRVTTYTVDGTLRLMHTHHLHNHTDRFIIWEDR